MEKTVKVKNAFMMFFINENGDVGKRSLDSFDRGYLSRELGNSIFFTEKYAKERAEELKKSSDIPDENAADAA